MLTMNDLKKFWKHLQLTESFAFAMLGIPVAAVINAIMWLVQFQLSEMQYDITVEKVVMFVVVGWFFLFLQFWVFAFVCGLFVTSFRNYVTQKWHCIIGGLACVLIQWLLIRQMSYTILIPTFVAGAVCTYVLVYAENLKEPISENP